MRPRFQWKAPSSVSTPTKTPVPRLTRLTRWAIAPMIAAAALSACSSDGVAPEAVGEAASASSSSAQPVSLALEIDNGVGAPLSVRAGQTFYLNQLDLRASLLSSVDEGVDGLKSRGDFAGLSWGGLELRDQDVAALPHDDGTVDRRRYYGGAKWMTGKSSFKLQQLNAAGAVVGPTVVVDIGADKKTKNKDDFFVRRLRAIQWTHDCASPTDCNGASQFEEEALVEVRCAEDSRTPFAIQPSTTALRLTWSLRDGPGYLIPVTQIAAPQYDYGFSINLDVLTPPRADGSYAPGSDVTVQATLRDGAGNRLHPQGTLPSYLDVEFGPNPAGIQYYHAFFDPTITYYRRKHRERMMIAQLVGPVQSVRSIDTVIGFDQFLGPSDLQQVATPSVDGYYGQAALFPRGNKLFGGAFDPSHQAWTEPVPDTWTFHLTEDAAAGTYLLTMKGSRVYLGEDLRVTTTVSLQVGSSAPTTPALTVGGCNTCHTGGGSLASIGHGNPRLSTCNGCHAPVGIELDTSIHARVHFVHARSSGRLDQPLEKCAMCHVGTAGIQRTSKSACLSCHTSYPPSHVAQFGPITSPFIGGGPESFGQCSTTCHTTHPSSGLH
jgi:hypothetical protein